MDLKDYIRSIQDYPKKGILFRDITTLIKDEKGLLVKRKSKLKEPILDFPIINIINGNKRILTKKRYD